MRTLSLLSVALMLASCGDKDSSVDADGDGFDEAEDCDDDDDAIFPGADERCDGLDNNCDGEVDEPGAIDGDPWYLDADNDGYGDEDDVLLACALVVGYAERGGDCDDGDASVYAGADELCDEIDNDCDEGVDEDVTDPTAWYEDVDGDGFGAGEPLVEACEGPEGAVTNDEDCDDGDPELNPNTPWYPDEDLDGFGADAGVDVTCEAPGEDWSRLGGDCDDSREAVYPGAEEICDDADSDCDGTVPVEEVDDDLDGYSECAGDTDDGDDRINPGALVNYEVGGSSDMRGGEGWVRGNHYLAEEDSILHAFEMQMEREGDCSVDFYVHVAEDDAWSLAWAGQAEVLAGSGYVESGSIDLEVAAGSTLALSVGWSCELALGLDYDEGWIGADAGVGALLGWQGSNGYAGYDEAYAPTDWKTYTNGAYDQVIWIYAL